MYGYDYRPMVARLHDPAGHGADARVPAQLPRPAAHRRVAHARELGPGDAGNARREPTAAAAARRTRRPRPAAPPAPPCSRATNRISGRASKPNIAALVGAADDEEAQRRGQPPVGRDRRARDARRAARRRRLPAQDAVDHHAPGDARSEGRRGRAQLRLPGRHQLDRAGHEGNKTAFFGQRAPPGGFDDDPLAPRGSRSR